MDGSRLAILIPAYREAATIGAVVAAAAAYGTVIVGDDNSPDGTGTEAEANGAIVVRSNANIGYEGNLNRLFEEAAALGFGAAVTMDADGEHDPKLLGEFRRHLLDGGVPLVLGVRPRKQRFAEIVMGVYVRARFGAKDILCGMKGYDLRLWRDNRGFDHTGSIGTELAISAIRRGAPFRQVAVSGVARRDAPRFDKRLRANWRILAALWRMLRQDVGICLPRH